MPSLCGTGSGPRTRTSKNHESAVITSGGRNVVIPRRMKDPEYRQSQLDSVHEEHIAPITDFISRLSAERPELAGVPFVAPHYRPETARILSLSSNPGPRAGGENGSGLLSVQNDDASAERMLKVYAAAGVRGEDVVPWNVFPWFVHEQLPNGLTSDYIEQGVHVLSRFLDLCRTSSPSSPTAVTLIDVLNAFARRALWAPWCVGGASTPCMRVTRATGHYPLSATASRRRGRHGRDLPAGHGACGARAARAVNRPTLSGYSCSR